MGFQSQSNRLDTNWVSGMKGVAILAIVLYHWFSFFTVGMVHQAARLGGQGVHIFIILSAFGLSLSIFKNKPVDWKTWYSKRFTKILIPYYIAIAITAVSLFLRGAIAARAWQGGIKVILSLKGGFLASIFLYRNFIDKYVMAVNSPWWFVTTIIEFYLIFPVLVVLYSRFGYKKFLLGTGIMTVLYQLLYSVVLGTESLVFARFFLTFLFEFSLGVFLADIFINDKSFLNSILLGAKPFIIGCIFEATGAFLGIKGGAIGAAFNDIFNAIGFFLIVYNFIYFTIRFNLLRRCFDFLGRYSLAIFLLHAPYILLFYGSLKGWALPGAIVLLPSYLLFILTLAWCFNRVILRNIPFLRKYFGAILE
jgi:peptidoglycan/LPS O-acetylase OafA/YrhL